MKLNNILFIALCFSIIIPSFGQSQYPVGYFMFPINPGQRNYLAGNMGELRTNHFHGGLDIKTGGREGLPVHASADGYVSRIKVSGSGYGLALYLTHPSGYVTVYGHLMKFDKAIENYVRQKQYEKESFEIDIFPDRNHFMFHQGDIIGLSGNTGSSAGPHLHFEIRDTLDHFIDPLLFGFKEIEDRLSPVIEKIALRTFDISSRVNGEYGRFEYKPVQIGNDYHMQEIIRVSGQIGVELFAYDRANETLNKYGVSYVEVTVDGREVHAQDINRLSFEKNRQILVHTDYPTAVRTGHKFQRLYISDGNQLDIYKHDGYKGKLFFNDSAIHEVQIKLMDVFKNKSILTFRVKADAKFIPPIVYLHDESQPDENIIKFSAKVNEGQNNLAKVFCKNKVYELKPAYNRQDSHIYLWDLRMGLPDSVNVSEKSLYYHFESMIPSGKEYFYTNRYLSLNFTEQALFDTLYLQTSVNKNIFTINHHQIPLRGPIEVTFTPFEPVENPLKTSVYSVNSKARVYEGGKWEDGAIVFKTRTLGNFILAADTIPPTIKLIAKNPQFIKFQISDNLSGINKFTARINGKWLLMHYDAKTKMIWSDRMDKNVNLKGDFELEVVDNVGNSSIFQTKF